jgi:hypothetical protein
MPDGVLVVCHMAKDPVEVALVITSPADHGFLLMLIASLLQDLGCLVFSLTLFRGKCCSIGIILNILTPVMCHLPTTCLSIDEGRMPREHEAHEL